MRVVDRGEGGECGREWVWGRVGVGESGIVSVGESESGGESGGD